MEKKYYTTIGLEIHAELATKTKMFCSCKNDPEEEKPNTNVCPVCLAHPGTLPVPNRGAIEKMIQIGLAVNGEIADFSEFDRKNYFYPDIPKGYQISQYKYPIVKGGKLADMDITRVHLEEDTGNNKHVGENSLIDFNRAGVPLSELVTEPHTFDSVEEASRVASNFAKEYQLLLQYLGVSHANMEKGEMRVEANVSISPDKDKKWSAYVEVKNLNSFKSVEKAIKYEYERMKKLFEEGKEGEIVKETRGWDEGKQKTISQRKKESSEDYRYFPDPDLPKLKLHEAFDLNKMKSELPELPVAKRARYANDFGIKPEDIEVYINNRVLSGNYEKTVKVFSMNKEQARAFSDLLINKVLGIKEEDIISDNAPTWWSIYNNTHAQISLLQYENKINSPTANVLLTATAKGEIKPEKNIEEYVKEKGLLQQNDEGALKEIVQKIINENSEVVATYKAGKENAIMSLVGKVIKESGGSANPQLVMKLLKELV